MKTNDKTRNVAIAPSLVLRVHVSRGETTEHIYLLPKTLDEATEVTNSLADYMGGRLSKGIGYAMLEYPAIIYSVQHIVYIEAIFRWPEEWEEIMKKSTKRPLGFRLEKASE